MSFWHRPIWVQQRETNQTDLSVSGMGAEIGELLSCKHPFWITADSSPLPLRMTNLECN